ncbi:hypothetical protein [Virgibacillus chiguensis]|uniref:Uncharacterized protein n=1 Tax=Virgibacillus chiguensis TaxID=411959 RepID=A0A1M5N0Q1_9BACI|nr:hypothetical protein [Virgibacillus chiguensis]SHG82563.1 hypothetical protein SAMN05421807_1028 [Virgibacillus chiguensis]
MQSIIQFQALDFLLKRIANQPNFEMYDKNLKLVVEINGTIWAGDFVNFNSCPYQLYVDSIGQVDEEYFYSDEDPSTSFVTKTWKEFLNHFKSDFSGLYLARVDDLSLLFKELKSFIESLDFEGYETPINPYLLNAKSLNENIELPFLNIENTEVKLISLIEVND